jgi:hypothetical protein
MPVPGCCPGPPPPPTEYLINVHCYTFGSPRVGNHAFVRLYNEAVPDTW